MTTARELILVDILFRDIDGLFLIKLFRHDEEFLLGCLFLLLPAYKRYVLSPSHVIVVLCLAVESVHILFAQQNDLLADGLEKLLPLAVVV